MILSANITGSTVELHCQVLKNSLTPSPYRIIFHHRTVLNKPPTAAGGVLIAHSEAGVQSIRFSPLKFKCMVQVYEGKIYENLITLNFSLF